MRKSWGAELRLAMAVEADDFAVEHSRTAAEFGE
jgi:hypothetical protein